mmetsp:Transcript_147391/g.455961  ORF Transcript_147391/g.455961 Transcript_147391/m.455961 type:complete len:244 (+) Transcript_147391:426-1157(+)
MGLSKRDLPHGRQGARPLDLRLLPVGGQLPRGLPRATAGAGHEGGRHLRLLCGLLGIQCRIGLLLRARDQRPGPGGDGRTLRREGAGPPQPGGARLGQAALRQQRVLPQRRRHRGPGEDGDPQDPGQGRDRAGHVVAGRVRRGHPGRLHGFEKGQVLQPRPRDASQGPQGREGHELWQPPPHGSLGRHGALLTRRARRPAPACSRARRAPLRRQRPSCRVVQCKREERGTTRCWALQKSVPVQ